MANVIGSMVLKHVKIIQVYTAFTILLCLFVLAISCNAFAILGRYEDGYANMDDDTLASVKGITALSVFSLLCIVIMGIMYAQFQKI